MGLAAGEAKHGGVNGLFAACYLQERVPAGPATPVQCTQWPLR